MKLVISNSKEGKTYSKKVEDPAYFYNKKIGETVNLQVIGLNDFDAQITGGSDAQGFPMKKFFAGTTRNKNFIIVDKKHGKRKRITQRGNTVSKEIAQLNLKITKFGAKKLSDLLVSEKKEDKKSAKEELVEASIKAAGTADAAKKMEKEEFKKGESKK